MPPSFCALFVKTICDTNIFTQSEKMWIWKSLKIGFILDNLTAVYNYLLFFFFKNIFGIENLTGTTLSLVVLC